MTSWEFVGEGKLLLCTGQDNSIWLVTRTTLKKNGATLVWSYSVRLEFICMSCNS